MQVFKLYMCQKFWNDVIDFELGLYNPIEKRYDKSEINFKNNNEWNQEKREERNFYIAS